MSIGKLLVNRKKTIIAIWVIALVAAIPAITGYSSFINYGMSSSVNSSSESAVAAQILQKAIPQNESLTVVVDKNPYGNLTLVSSILSFQQTLLASGISNITGSSSPYTAYSGYLNQIIGSYTPTIRSVYSGMENASRTVYDFPYSFLVNWSYYDYNSSLTYQAAVGAGYNASQYQALFLQSVNSTAQTGNYTAPPAIVQEAVRESSYVTYNYTPFAYSVTNGLNVMNYTTGVPGLVSSFIYGLSGYRLSEAMIVSAVSSDNLGSFFVGHYGLEGIPSFISGRYISPDNSTFLIDINFNTPSGYVGNNGTSPSQSATPAIQNLATEKLGPIASVTGQGAIAYQTQQVTSSSEIAFAFIFVVLAIAVFLTLVAYLASVITLILVSIASALGYVAIFITGLIFGSVDYVVNYTLTAVILGVATDYLVFILSRYRQEIRIGKDEEDALDISVSKAGKAVLISGVTVAVSLGMFSLIPGFRSWGLVLFIAILLTVAMELTLLPAILKLIGPRIFMKRSLKPLPEDYFKNSFFYRASKVATKKKALVIGTIFILAAPSVFIFFTLPTTYDFNTGLPAGLSSVQALKTIENKFGANVIYPVYVIVPLSGSSSGNLSSTDIVKLQNAAALLNSTSGVSNVVGPYYNSVSGEQSVSSYVFDNGNYSYFIAYTPYNPYSSQAENVVKSLRANDSILVGGITSSVLDQKVQNQRTYTELAALIVASIGVILYLSFRSVKYPLISLSGVFISIVWTTAILVAITSFILHESLIYLIPIILFVILMSLGNDYTVFVISRVREEEDPNNPDEGIARGMVGSGKVVTSLGLILAASLGSLAFIPVGFLQQLGLAFIISLILDTFVIRTLYFPAMISLFSSKKGGGPEEKY